MVDGEIKLTHMYRSLSEFLSNLTEHALSDPSSTMNTFSSFDHIHYLGTQPLDAIISLLPTHANVLEIGSGIGGPARYICSKSTSRMCTLEILPDFVRLSEAINTRLSFDINTILGDILDSRAIDSSNPKAPINHTFDMVYSILCFLHIDDKVSLFSRLSDLVVVGGYVFIEDFGRSDSAFTAEELSKLSTVVSCNGNLLLTRAEYISSLENVGFKVISYSDMTRPWKVFTAERARKFKDQLPQHIAFHGNRVAYDRMLFLQTVVDLFVKGSLTGCRIIAQKL